jgi:hypothetical protein
VTIAGLAEPVEGRIEVELEDMLPRGPMSPGETAALTSRTAVPASLGPGGSKHYTLYVVPRSLYLSGSLAYPVTARVRSRSGARVQANGKGSLRLLPLGSRLLVAATGDAAGLQGWDGRPCRELGWAERETLEEPRFAEPVLRVAHVLPAALPEEWQDYDAADLAIVAGRAWVAMTDRQRRALRLWVEGGGRAVLYGEQAADWRDPEARRLVPGALRDAAFGRASQAAAVIHPRDDARPFLSAGEAVIGCTAPAGFGAVLWLGVDPFRAGAALAGRGQPGDRRALWRALVTHATAAPVTPSRLGRLSDNPTAVSLANILPRLPAPSPALLGSIAIAYVLIFGPLNIRVLRALSRGETAGSGPSAWLFLPALALVMTLVLLAIGRSWGQSRALLNRVSVVEAMSGAATGWEQGLNGLFSPTNAAYTVEAGDRAMLLSLVDAGSAGFGGPPTGIRYGGPEGPPGTVVDPKRPEMRSGALPTLQLEESCRWEEVPLALWTLQNQSYERLADLDGAVTVSLTRWPGAQPSGTVRNGTALHLARAYLQFEGHRRDLGDLEPGAARVVPASGWRRRRMAEDEGAVPVPGFGFMTGALEPEEPGAASAPSAMALYEAAIVLLRPGGGGRAPRPEALLVAETAELMAPLSVFGVTATPRAALLLVRAPVGR